MAELFQSEGLRGVGADPGSFNLEEQLAASSKGTSPPS